MDSITAMKDQLVEIFPHIEENFLKGLCEAFESENADIAQMVENVLSFEFPPLKESVENAEENLLNFTELNTDITVNQVPYVEQTSSDSSDSGISESVLQANKVPEHVDKVNEILVNASYDASQIKGEKTKLIRFDESLVYPGDMFDETIKEESSTASPSDDSDFEEGTWEEFDDKFIEEKPKQESTTQTQYLTYSMKQGEFEGSVIGQNSASLNGFSDLADVKPSVFSSDVSDESTNVLHIFESMSNDTESCKLENQCNVKTETCQPSTSSFGLEVVVEPKKEKLIHRKSVKKTHSVVSYKSKRPVYRSCKLSGTKPKLLRNSAITDASKIKQELEGTKQESDSKNVSNFNDAESKFALLSQVLPEADINFLLAQSKTLPDQEALLSFISKSLATRDYPKDKKEDPKVPNYMEKFACNIEDFLREIPDPAAEFSSQFYTRAGYKGNAEVYLKSKYPDISMTYIRELLAAHGYNLTMVSEILDQSGAEGNPFCLENLVLHHDADIFFHQEVWYIENKKEIHDYLDSVLEAVKMEEELNRPPTPPTVEEVFECSICSEDIVEYLELGTCDGPQGHLFCKTCVRRSTEVKLADGDTKFPCLHNCGGLIPLQTIEEVLPPHTYSILCDKIQEEEIRLANVAAVETCPFCPYAYGPGDEQYFTCNRPSCMKISCRTCRKEAHGDQICDMFKNEDEETARHIIENRMSDALIRYCYSCKKPLVKSSGCNKMTCTCGAKMCYICRQPVTDYTHFNGQGGDATEKCELFSQDETLHERPVAASAQAALNEIQANNPGLQLDPSKLIPK